MLAVKRFSEARHKYQKELRRLLFLVTMILDTHEEFGKRY